jgi:hypothetical protein
MKNSFSFQSIIMAERIRSNVVMNSIFIGHNPLMGNCL